MALLRVRGAASASRPGLRLRKHATSALAVMAVLALLFLASTFVAKGAVLRGGDSLAGRQLLSSGGCSSPKEDWENKGGVIVYIVGIIYLFLGIAIVCDDFFVASLEAVSEALNLSEDVAGATFMAAGSSAPELFSSAVSLSNPNTSNELGIGTIVGSAVFNILVIIAVTAIFAGTVLHLDWRPLVRDATFYTAAVVSIIGVFWDGKVYWWEGMIFVFLYGGYILCMAYNQQLMTLMARMVSQPTTTMAVVPSDREAPPATPTMPIGRMVVVAEAPSNKSMPLPPMEIEKPQPEEEEEEHKWWQPPARSYFYPIWLLSLPWYAFMTVTIPDCKAERWKKWYLLSFAMSIAWIGVISWYMVEWAARIGCIWGIPDAIMGVTVLAAGTSIPDALSSIAVAKEGMGNMAVANAVGSNVFDIWLGIGLPWWVVLLIKQQVNEVSTRELLPNVLILLGVVVLYMSTIVASGWKMGKRAGIFFLVLYGVYALYNIVAVWLLDIYNTDR